MPVGFFRCLTYLSATGCVIASVPYAAGFIVPMDIGLDEILLRLIVGIVVVLSPIFCIAILTYMPKSLHWEHLATIAVIVGFVTSMLMLMLFGLSSALPRSPYWKGWEILYATRDAFLPLAYANSILPLMVVSEFRNQARLQNTPNE